MSEWDEPKWELLGIPLLGELVEIKWFVLLLAQSRPATGLSDSAGFLR
ncbi:hypothetical protein [Paenibacillus sp. 32O-W]|nr:hypothetical protein [Paenibacillus sp. 32O-W]